MLKFLQVHVNVQCILRIAGELHVFGEDLILVFLPERRLLLKCNSLFIFFFCYEKNKC